jgi:arginine decarboxylase
VPGGIEAGGGSRLDRLPGDERDQQRQHRDRRQEAGGDIDRPTAAERQRLVEDAAHPRVSLPEPPGPTGAHEVARARLLLASLAVPADAAQTRAPYLEALVEYAGRDPGRFHVPGHKGGPGADPGALEAIGAAAFDLDIPALIEGIDVGPPEPTPFQQAQDLAAEAWGARRSWFLINGASQGNKATCLAIRHTGKRVVVQRNVHSSTIDGLVVAGLEPTFVAPEVDPDLGIAHCVTPDALAKGLDLTPGAIAALVVSPTYFGAVADVAGLAEAAHDHDVPLLVDEAWGAHMRFSERLPASALDQGADLVLSSVHKIVGSLTQSAILHLGAGELIDEADVDRAVTLTESTSPSALLCASLDAARRHAVTRGEELLSETIDALERARADIRALPGLDVLDERLAGRAGVAGWDPLRLAVDVRGTGTTGHRVAALMHELDDVNLELASESVVVGVFGMGAPAAPAVERLIAALRHAVTTLGEVEHEPARPFAPPPPWGPLRMPPRDAFLAPQDVVPLDAAEGRVAAESLATYPPGVPNVLPGEVLTAETLDYVRETLAHGGAVRGAVDRSLRTIRVVAG